MSFSLAVKYQKGNIVNSELAYCFAHFFEVVPIELLVCESQKCISS